MIKRNKDIVEIDENLKYINKGIMKKDGRPYLPITHESLVVDNDGVSIDRIYSVDVCRHLDLVVYNSSCVLHAVKYRRYAYIELTVSFIVVVVESDAKTYFVYYILDSVHKLSG